MKRKDVAALIVGVGIFIIFIPVVLSYFGIDIPNPFQPMATVVVTINPDCWGSLCEITPERTSIDVTVAKPLGIFQMYLCVPEMGVYGWVRPKLSIRNMEGRLIYSSAMKPSTKICNTPVSFDFKFNYIKGECYNLNLDVYDGQGSKIIYSKMVRECL